MRRFLEWLSERFWPEPPKPLTDAKLTAEEQLEIARVVESEVEKRVRRAIKQYNFNLAIVLFAIMGVAYAFKVTNAKEARDYLYKLFSEHDVQKEYQEIRTARSNAVADASELRVRLESIRNADNVVRLDKNGAFTMKGKAPGIRMMSEGVTNNWASLTLSTQLWLFEIWTYREGISNRWTP